MILPNIIEIGIFNSKLTPTIGTVSKDRKVDRFEIELPLEEGGIAYIDSNSFPISPNTIVAVKPNQIRHTKFPLKCYYVHLTLPKGQLYDILSNTPDFLTTNKHKTYEKIFTKLLKHYNPVFQKPNEEIIVQSLILELIYTISNEIATEYNTNKSSNNVLLIENTYKYIKEHLTEDLQLEKIANEMSLSPIYFHKKFKDATGKTLHAYIEEQRLKKAINLLQTTDYTLSKIAYDCGFSSQSYFNYVFKRAMKQTPRQFVEEFNKKYKI